MSLAHRVDNRTIEQFAKDIKRDTEREKVAASLLKSDLIERGHKIEVNDFGIDNSGGLVTSRVTAKPDYEFSIDGKDILIEIKVSSNEYPCMTFKVCDLKNYINHKAFIFVVVEDGYYIFYPKVLEHMLKTIEPQIYEKFSPNDKAVRIDKGALSVFIMAELVKRIKWSDKTKELAEKHKEIFARRKK